MAHKTLIGGTAYEIGGGKTLVGGTAYSIDKGKALVDGTAYEVGFRKKQEILDDWATIASGANISNYALGDWKPIELTDGTTAIMEIVAFNADTKTDGTTAPITWISKGLITSRVMHSSSSTSDGWLHSGMRTWLLGDFYATLPNEVRAAIVSVNKTYYDYNTQSTLNCADSIWIPSAREIFNTCESAGAEYTSYFTDDTSRIKQLNGINNAWWLRSAATKSNYYRVTYAGTSGTYRAAGTGGVCVGFCT